MLAVVRSRTTVGLQIVLYAWATAISALLLIPVAGMGLLYTVVALASGAYFVIESHLLYSAAIHGREGKPMRLFHGSIGYLTILFLGVALDPFLRF